MKNSKQKPFSNPPTVRNTLLQPPQKREPPPIKTHKMRGIQVSPYLAEITPVEPQSKFLSQFIIFLVFFLSLTAQSFLVSEQNFYYSRGIAIFDSYFEGMSNSAKSVIKILFASIISFAFYNISSIISSESFISCGLVTIALFFDSDLMTRVFNSFGFSLALITSLLSIYFSLKMINVCFKSREKRIWHVFQFLQIISITVSCIFKYELCFLYAMYLVAFLSALFNKKYQINDKLLCVFSTLLFSLLSFLTLHVLDSKTQIMRISFDLPSSSDLFVKIIQNDRNGLIFISLVLSIPCYLYSLAKEKFTKADFIIMFTSVITFLLAFVFAPLSDSPDILMRAIVVRLTFITFSAQILSKATFLGIISSLLILFYSISSHFITLPHLTFLQQINS